MAHIGLEIAFSLPDGTMCKVKAQTEAPMFVTRVELQQLFDDASVRALAVAALS